MTSFVTDWVSTAEKLACEYHDGQKYGKLPYVSGHLDPVMLQADVIATGLGWDQLQVRQVVATAYLHDILEDTHCELLALHDSGIPQMVITAVELLTKGSESYSQYLHTIASSKLATVVKLADSMVNLRACLSDGKIEKSLKYANNINFLAATIHRWNK